MPSLTPGPRNPLGAEAFRPAAPEEPDGPEMGRIAGICSGSASPGEGSASREIGEKF
jgi:hypothetical protein